MSNGRLWHMVSEEFSGVKTKRGGTSSSRTLRMNTSKIRQRYSTFRFGASLKRFNGKIEGGDDEYRGWWWTPVFVMFNQCSSTSRLSPRDEMVTLKPCDRMIA
jgi:hypothetical protein